MENKLNYNKLWQNTGIFFLISIIVIVIIKFIGVTKKSYVSEIKLLKQEMILYVNDSQKIPYEVSNQNITLNWQSSNQNIATVSMDGMVKGIKPGNTTISVKTANGQEKSCQVIVREALSLNKNIINLMVDEEEQLTINTSDKIIWQSQDDTIASVDALGKVKALKEGKTIIEGKVNDHVLTCEVNILGKKEVTSITLNVDKIVLEVDNTYQLVANILPVDAFNKKIIWSSSNDVIASIDQNGMIKALKEGTTIIKVVTENNKEAVCEVTVKNKVIEVNSITLNNTSINMQVGDSKQLIATINPSNATNKTLGWASSNSNIVTVDNNGNIVAKGSGNAEIVVKSSNSKEAICKVTVSVPNYDVTSINLDISNIHLFIGTTKKINATINPSNATNKTLIWASSNSNIATVDNNGNVVAKGIGSTSIIVKSINGKQAICNVNVKGNQFQVPLRNSKNEYLYGADPFVTYYNGYYYFLATKAHDVEIYRSRNLYDIGKPDKTTIAYKNPYAPSPWAPELHLIDGRWYIYFANSPDTVDGNINRRMYVLRSKTSDPMGEYEFMGRIYDAKNDYFAIDGTILQYKGTLYFIYAGYANSISTKINLYIAKMKNPWTIDGERALLSKPDYSWEGWVNEGPEVLIKNDTLHIIYSANGAGTTEYALGMLTYNGQGDIMRGVGYGYYGVGYNVGSWHKSRIPLFNSGNGVYGPGHVSFTTSPDGKEDWLVYHAYESNNADLLSGWRRTTRIKQFTWNGNDPVFGEPDATNTFINVPSGSTP